MIFNCVQCTRWSFFLYKVKFYFVQGEVFLCKVKFFLCKVKFFLYKVFTPPWVLIVHLQFCQPPRKDVLWLWFLTSNCQSPIILPRLQWCHSSLWRWQSSWMFGLLVGMPSSTSPLQWRPCQRGLQREPWSSRLCFLSSSLLCSPAAPPWSRRQGEELIARLLLMLASRNPWREQYRHCWLIHPQLPLLNQPPHHLLHLLRPLLQWRSPLLLLWLPGQQQFLSVTDAQQPLKMNAV